MLIIFHWLGSIVTTSRKHCYNISKVVLERDSVERMIMVQVVAFEQKKITPKPLIVSAAHSWVCEVTPRYVVMTPHSSRCRLHWTNTGGEFDPGAKFTLFTVGPKPNKWSTFCWQCFQCNFWKENICILIQWDFLLGFWLTVSQSALGWGNDFALNMRQAITSNNSDLVLRHVFASPGFNGLMLQYFGRFNWKFWKTVGHSSKSLMR